MIQNLPVLKGQYFYLGYEGYFAPSELKKRWGTSVGLRPTLVYLVLSGHPHNSYMLLIVNN